MKWSHDGLESIAVNVNVVVVVVVVVIKVDKKLKELGNQFNLGTGSHSNKCEFLTMIFTGVEPYCLLMWETKAPP